MAFVRLLGILVKDKNIGKQIVPIVPDESRTFGMEGMFRQLGIFSQVGQLYTPQDADQLMFYKEDQNGQILQEGINEAGGMADWIAAATSYANHGMAMMPFYIYYSMFGFQRVGDLAWAAGDMRSRGFLLGGTAGRTTLNGEGLQHQDGHSHLSRRTIPNCVSYDPTFAYELAVIIHDGMRRMYVEQQDVFYYLTVMNENYAHPAMPKGAEAGHHQGHVLLSARRQAEARSRQCNCWAADHPARSDRRRGIAGKGFRRRIGHLERDQLHRIAPRRDGLRTLEHAASGSEPASVMSSNACRAQRPGDRRDRLHALVRRPDPRLSCPDATRCWARTVSAVPTRARNCAASSRWIATTSPLPH